MKLEQVDWEMAARFALLSRKLDQLEVESLAPQGKIKYQFSSGGHELAQVLLAQALEHPHDAAVTYYRSRPFVLASGLTVREALAAGMARQGSPSEGRDVGVVYNLLRRSGPTILPSSGDVGSQYTPAVGWAQAILYRKQVLGESDWSGAIAVATGGEASTATNGFWAGLNIATTLALPVLFFIEDNQYGLSVPAALQTPGGDIARNLESFRNLLVIDADGTDPMDAWRSIHRAVSHVRSGEGACLLRMRVVRLSGHTLVDDQAYKSPETIASEAAQDPLSRLHVFFSQHKSSEQSWEALSLAADQELAEALAEAEALPEPPADQFTSHLVYQGTSPLQGGLRPEGAILSLEGCLPDPAGPRINMLDAVRRTLQVEMRSNPRMLVFGEDVGVKGGVHGATIDMQAHFGELRVFDTSLNEEGIIGRSTGMALAGLLPVPEIQFRKYADPAYEQLNDLGSIRWRTANRFAAPVVVRIPVGYGKKTGDPWHSVSGEATLAHLHGWRIAYPSNAEDAVGLLRTALRGDDPTFFLEHRALLDTAPGRRVYPGDSYCLPFGSAKLLTDGGGLTVVTWGAMVQRCVEAASTLSDQVCIVDLRTIVPWDAQTVLECVRKTGKIMVVHEDTWTGGFAGEIIATVASQAFTHLDAPIERMAVPDIPIPYNMLGMETVIPSVVEIRTRMQALLYY